MTIYVLYDGADLPDAIDLQGRLSAVQGLSGPVKSLIVPAVGGTPSFSPVDNDAVIVIWSGASRTNTALTATAAQMAGENRLVQVAATGQPSQPGVIPISNTAAIVQKLKQPPFVPPAPPPADGLLTAQTIMIVMAVIIAVVILLIWIAPSDDHLDANCRTSYTQDGYPIEHCEDSYY